MWKDWIENTQVQDAVKRRSNPVIVRVELRAEVRESTMGGAGYRSVVGR